MPAKNKSQAARKGRDVFYHDGEPSVFTCPDCSGTLFLLKQKSMIQYRCRIGHLYSPESMSEAQSENVERSLWTALRALEEQAEFSRQMAQEMEKAPGKNGSKRYRGQSQAALRNTKVLRAVIEDSMKNVAAP